MLDIDHFKNYNDAHGHPAGDQLLRNCATAWTGALRTSDRLRATAGGVRRAVARPETLERAARGHSVCGPRPRTS